MNVQISLKILRRQISFEGEVYQDMKTLKINPDRSDETCIFFVWPLEIVHVIDEESPFYEMAAADLAKHPRPTSPSTPPALRLPRRLRLIVVVQCPSSTI